MLQDGIQELDLNNSQIRDAAWQLQKFSFNQTFLRDQIRLNTTSQSTIAPTLYLGAIKGGELIAFNAFFSHDFLKNGERINAYQICWSATHPQHRGQGLFCSIIKAGIDKIKKRGAAFLFCYPNELSEPIFARELGFKRTELVKVQIPTKFPFPITGIHPWKDHEILLIEDGYLQYDSQLIKQKKRQFGEEIIVFEFLHNVIWGKLRKKKYCGLNLKYFDVGGMTVDHPHFFKKTIRKLISTYRPDYLQWVLHPQNAYCKLFSKVAPAPHTEPFLFYDLKNCIDEKTGLHLMAGIKDVF